jgi:hypothetical protein
VIDITLSDLFFNHEHANYDLLMNTYARDFKRSKLPSYDEISEAVLKDASEFISYYGSILACRVPTAEELAKDFTRRL